MRYRAFVLATLLIVFGSDTGFATTYCEHGQQPAPPALAAQIALPQCGFAATESWGPNGCQLCDARNFYGGVPVTRPSRN